MIEEKAIRVGIRSLGLVFVPAAILAIIRLVSYAWALCSFGVLSFYPRTLNVHWSLGILKQLAILWVTFYLLCCGATLHRFMIKKCCCANATEGNADVIGVIVIRTMGLWLYLRGLLEVLSLLLLSVNCFLFSGQTSHLAEDGSVSSGHFISSLISTPVFIQSLVTGIGCLLAALYLVERGGFVIDWVNCKRRSSPPTS